MTTWPKPLQNTGVSTVISPVTQTADVAVNSASSRLAPPPPALATGSNSSPVPTATAAAKPSTITWAGWRGANARMNRVKPAARARRTAGTSTCIGATLPPARLAVADGDQPSRSCTSSRHFRYAAAFGSIRAKWSPGTFRSWTGAPADLAAAA